MSLSPLSIHHVSVMLQQLLALIYSSSQSDAVVAMLMDLLSTIHEHEFPVNVEGDNAEQRAPPTLPRAPFPSIVIMEGVAEGSRSQYRVAMRNFVAGAASSASAGVSILPKGADDDKDSGADEATSSFSVQLCLPTLKQAVNWRPDHLRQIIHFMIFVVRSLHYENYLLADLHAHVHPSVDGKGSRGWPRWKRSIGGEKLKWSTTARSFPDSADCRHVHAMLREYYSDALPAPAGDGRFHTLRECLDATILSSSPMIRYPAPYLLQRLEREEAETALADSTTSVQADNLQVPQESVTSKINRLSAYSVSRFIPSSSDRASLESMIKNNDSIDGRFSHQSLLVLTSIQVDRQFRAKLEPQAGVSPPCQAETHKFIFFQYGDMATDITLGDFVRKMVAQAEMGCRSDGDSVECTFPLKQHVFTYAHGDARIVVKNHSLNELRRTLPQLDFPPSHQCDSPAVLAWTTCIPCFSNSPVVPLSAEAECYSFSKFLELLLYSPLFFPHGIDLCSTTKVSNGAKHTGEIKAIHPTHRQRLVRYFACGDRVLSFHYEPIEMLEISLMALSSPVAGLSGAAGEVNAADGYGHVLTDARQFHSFESYISAYWKSIYEYLDSLAEPMSSDYSSLILPKYTSLFRDRLCAEERSMNEMLSMVRHELMRMERISSRAESGGLSTSDVFSSPTLIVRGLRKAIADKTVAIDREIAYWMQTIRHDFPNLPNMPAYNICLHPDSAWRSSWSNAIQNDKIDLGLPSSLIAFALESAEVRDLLGLLEEVSALIKLHENTDGLDEESMSAESWITRLRLQYENVLKMGSYPTKFETTHDDGSMTGAHLDEALHIHFRYSHAVTNDSQGDDSFSTGKHMRASSGASATSGDSSRTRKKGGSMTEFTVTIHYAYLYHLLRSRAGLVSEDFVRSLDTCRGWTPTGGKSGSKFYVTEDERFVIKALGKERASKSRKLSRSLSRSPSRPLASSRPSSRNCEDVPENGPLPSSAQTELLPSEEERRMMLNFAPKYLMYVLGSVLPSSAKSTRHPSLLVKMLGVYTIKCRKVDSTDLRASSGRSSAKWSQMNYVVMEHLFRERKIRQKFDLKGIRSRTVDAAAQMKWTPLFRLFTTSSPADQQQSGSNKVDDNESRCRTLWDGNWLENVYKHARIDPATGIPMPGLAQEEGWQGDSSTMYVHPHSKYLLREAMRHDTEFLARCNVIDYSLLVGVDQDRWELVVGIVDYIGEYTFWKRLENKGKTTLMYLEKRLKDVVKLGGSGDSSDGKKTSLAALTPPASPADNRTSWSSASTKVTVQPPDVYRARFASAMDDYFMTVPDKWTLTDG